MKKLKILMNYLLFPGLLLLLLVPVQASGNDFGSARHALGFSGGSAMGPGLTYRYYSSRAFFQGAFFTRITSQDDMTDFMLSASYGRIISEISIVKALPPTALVFIASIDGRYSKDQYINSVNVGETDDEKSVHTGAGIALEIGNTFSPGLLFSLGTTYTLSIERQNGNWEWNLGPQVNVGLLYNW